MKVLYLFIVLYILGINAQRRPSLQKLDIPNSDTSSQNPVPRGRGRARFSLTADVEDAQLLQDDVPRTSRRNELRKQEVPKVVEKKINRPAKPQPSIGFYEVSETVDDIPREDLKKPYVIPRVITESRFENLNLARPPPTKPTSPEKIEEFIPSESPSPSSSSATPIEVSSKEPEVTVSEAPKPSSTSPDVPKVPHRRFNVRTQTPSSRTQTSGVTTEKTIRRKNRVRNQVKSEPSTTNIPTISGSRRTHLRTNKRPDSGPSVFNSESTGTIRSRTERRATPIIERRSDEEETFFIPVSNQRRRNYQPRAYPSDKSSEGIASRRNEERETSFSGRTNQRHEATSKQPAVVESESERPARKRLVSSRKVQSTTTTTVTPTEPAKVNINQRRRGRYTVPDEVSARSISRKTRSTTPSRADSTTQATDRTQQRSRVRSRPLQNAQLQEKPKPNLNRLPAGIDDFATSSTKEVEVRMPIEELNKRTSVSPRTTIKVSRLQTISVETKTEKAIRKVYRKRPPVVNAPRVASTEKVQVAEGRKEASRRGDFGRQGSRTRVEGRKNERVPGELSNSQEAIGDADNYPAPYIATIQAKKKNKESNRPSSNQSSEDSLTKNTKKGAASISPSATLESPVPSESAFIENIVTHDDTVLPIIKAAKSKENLYRLAFPTRKSTTFTTVPEDAGESTITTEANQTPLQKYHARFKNNRFIKPEVFTTQKPSKNRTFSPKAPIGIYSSRKFFKSTTIVPDEIDLKAPVKYSVETSALSTQVPPKGFNPKKVNRFSSRYRNDIPRPIGLRTSTSGPTYIPTVPTVTPSSVKTEDNLLGLEFISLDDPISNTVPSANLVNEDLTSTIIDSTTVASKDNSPQIIEKPVSIIERIINSIASISTTTPPDVITKITTLDTNEPTTTSSAILNLVSKKTKDLDQTDSESKTTPQPTTVIEKILSSLTAIRANEGEITQVGNYNTLSELPSTQSMSTTTSIPPSTILSTSTVSSNTDSILSTLLSIDDSSTPFVDTNSISTRSISTTLLSTQATSTLDPAFEEITSDQTLPKRTLDQLLSLFNVGTTPTTVEPTTKIVIVTPKLTTFITSEAPAPSTTVSLTEPTTIRSVSTTQPSTQMTQSPNTESTTQTYQTTQTTQSVSTTQPSTQMTQSPNTESTTQTSQTAQSTQSSTFSTEQTQTISSFPTSTERTTESSQLNTQQVPPVTDTVNSASPTTLVTEQTIESTTQNDDLNLIANPLAGGDSNVQTELLSIIDFISQLRMNSNTDNSQTSTIGSFTESSPISTFSVTREQPSTLPTIFTTETPTSTLPTFMPNDISTIPFSTTEVVPTTTDDSSTIALLDRFKVSPDQVQVFSANDLTSTVTNEDITTSTELINSSTDTTNQDVSSNTIDTNSVTDKLVSNETDVSNLVNSLSAITNETVNSTLFTSQLENQTRSGKLLNFSPNPIDNKIEDAPPTPRDKDYFIFAVLQNNTILRKRPSLYPTKETPFLIYGLLPNNTLVQKFPNGTIVPMERVIRVNGFDTRENPPPVTENVNQENRPDSNESTGVSIDANQLSVNDNNNRGNSLPKLTEILGKMTVSAFNDIVNQTKADQTKIETLQVDPKVEAKVNVASSTTSTTARTARTNSPVVATTVGKPTTTQGTSTMKIETPTSTILTTTAGKTTTTTKTETPTSTILTTTSGRTTTRTERPTSTILTTTAGRTTTQRSPPTVIITTTQSRRRSTTTQPPATTILTTTQSRRRTTTNAPSTTTFTSTLPEDSTNEIDPNPLAIAIPQADKTLTKLKQSALSDQQKKDLATLEALEREQKHILQQLSFLTNLNLGKTKSTNDKNNIASTVIGSAVDKTTIKPSEINAATPPIDDLLKQININGVNGITLPAPVVSATYGKTNDALLASLLKEYGVVPTPPKPLADFLDKQITTTSLPNTTPRKRTPTTTPAPNRFMQGITWLFNTLAPQPPTNAPQRKPKSKPNRQNFENEVLSKQPTEITPVTVYPPSTPMKIDMKSAGLTDAKLVSLIKQLEEVQRNPSKAKDLDEDSLKMLQKIKSMQKALKSNDVQGIQVFSSSSNGANAKRFVTTALPPTTTGKLSLPPVKLNSIPGIPDATPPLIRGQLVDYAINVTKAISSFLGNALQGAASSFQSMFESGSRMARSSSKSNSKNKPG